MNSFQMLVTGAAGTLLLVFTVVGLTALCQTGLDRLDDKRDTRHPAGQYMADLSEHGPIAAEQRAELLAGESALETPPVLKAIRKWREKRGVS